jgi:hypothetical protein
MLILAAAMLFGAADPDAVELGRLSSRALEENRPKTQQYAYREYYDHRQLNAEGTETDRETETWDIIGLEGYSYRKLILRNDKPLSSKEQGREDARLKKETERRRKESPEEKKKSLFSLQYSYRMPYDKLADVFHLRYLGEREFDGRRLQLIDATPNLEFPAQTADEKESRNWHFVLWLDPDAAFPMRIEADIVGEHSRLQKGTTLRQDWTRLPDGTWMPKILTIRYAARLMKLHTVHGEAIRTFTDFHKFAVESKLLGQP